MATLSATNTKYTAEQLTKTTGVSAETLANWGLVESTDALTISQLTEMASSDAQAKTVLDKIIAQNAQSVANGKVTASNVVLTASEGGATLATGTFTTAIKANISAMWTWMKTTPLGWLTLLAAGVFAIVKAYDALTVSVEEQKEKMEDSLSEYEDAKSELSGITSELESQEQAIDDLLVKDKLTYAENGQLAELQAITKELRIQKDLTEKEEDRTEKQLAKDASELFNKQFGDYDISENAIKEYQNGANSTRNNVILYSDPNDISAMIAAYRQYNELLNEAYVEKNQDDIDFYKSYTEVLRDSIFSTAQELQTQQENISAYYEKIENTPYDDLTTEQKEIVDSYNAISGAIDLIYQQLDPNTWKSMHIENVFDTEDIEKTKEELVEMAKSGKLTPKMIKGYTNLNNALTQAGISAEELYQQIMALSNPDAINYDISKSQLLNVLGISTDLWDRDRYNDLVNQGFFEEDALEAFLTVKAKFTDGETEYWSVEDWKQHIQDELNKSESITISDIFSLKDAENNATALSDLSDQLSSIEDAYNACLAAKEEYDEQGYLSVDTLQKVLSLGDEYLQYLFDEEGNVRLDAEAFQQLAQARINDMEAQALSNLAENIKQITNEATATEYLTQKQNVLASSYADVAANALFALSTVDGFADSKALQGAYNSFKTQYEQIKSLFANTRKGLSSTYTTKSSSSSSKSSLSSSDPLKDAFTQEYNTLKHNLEMEYITEKQYYDSLDALNQKYFAGKSEYLDEYRQYEEEVYKGLKSYYKDFVESQTQFLKSQLENNRISYSQYASSVGNLLTTMFQEGKISAQDYWDYVQDKLESQLSAMDQTVHAVVNRLDSEIESYENQIDEVEDRYQTEIDYLDTVIKYYEDQKKALQDANDERDRQLALEQALYNLQRSQTQRTKKLYTTEGGFVYTVDNNAIQDANEEVSKAKLDIEIAKLDEAIEKVEQQQDALQDAMDREKEQLQQTIDRLEEYKGQWQSVADEYENVQNEMMAQQVLGTEWETDILNCRLDTLTNFKNQYITLQQEMANAAWNSANEQIKAAKAAGGSTGSAGSVGSATQAGTVGGNLPSVSNTKSNISPIKKPSQQKSTAVIGNHTSVMNKTAKNTIQRYGSGTSNAKPGYHFVAEDDEEIIRDNYGNAFVAKGEQLYPFEGGETVIKASDTKKILANMKNLTPLDDIASLARSNYSAMLKPDIALPDYSNLGNTITKNNNSTPVVQNVTLTLPNVTNTSGYERLQKELRQMQIDAVQFAHKN